MDLVVSSSSHEEEPYVKYPLTDDEVLELSLDFFDKDGYEITRLEQEYLLAHNVDLSEKHNKHTADHHWWFRDEDYDQAGVVLDHSMYITRWAFADEAREQLERLKEKRPLLNKLLMLQPKWGIDISVDIVTPNICTELFHIEIDKLDYNEIVEVKEKIEEKVLKLDMEQAAKDILSKQYEWQMLSSDDQSDWKVQYLDLGVYRAFDNKKVWLGSHG